MSEVSLFPYTERSGVNASEDVANLLRDPEVYLDDQEKDAVYAFAHGLFEGYINDELRVVDPDGGQIPMIYKLSTVRLLPVVIKLSMPITLKPQPHRLMSLVSV